MLGAGGLFRTLPAGFLPNEDQGAFFVSVRLPDSASTERTDAAVSKIESVLSKVAGRGQVFRARRTRYCDRHIEFQRRYCDLHVEAVGRAQERGTAARGDSRQSAGRFRTVPEAFTFAFGLPPILGLSPTGGFQFMLEDRAGGDVALLQPPRILWCGGARQRPELANVISTFRPSVPTYSVKMDTDKIQTLGVPLTDAYNTLQTFLGGLYVNDFNQFGRVWQVLVQAQPEFRSQPSDISRFFVRNSQRRDGASVHVRHRRAEQRP